MGVYKHGTTWWLDYYYNGERTRRRVGPKKDEARILHAQILTRIRQGGNPALMEIKPKPFADMAREFLERHAKRQRNYEGFENNVTILLRHFGGSTLQEITSKAVADFIAVRLEAGVSKATTNRQRACLSKMFSCATDWGYYGGENPVRRVKAFPEPPGRFRFLDAGEAARLIEHVARHLRSVIICALHTGGRLTEVLRLRWSDVDLTRGVLYFDQTNTKSGKQREIPIDAELAAMLREMAKVQKIEDRDPDRLLFTWAGKPFGRVATGFTTGRKRAGLGKDVTFHTLRHTFASWYMMNGGDLFRLQKYMGHSDIKLTQRYAHLSPAHLQAGVEFFGPPSEKRGHTTVTNGQFPELAGDVSG